MSKFRQVSTDRAADEQERSLPARRLVAQLEAAARTDLPVLFEGETGTGKERLARRLHELGAGAADPFVVLRCASMSDSLIEAELFGKARSSGSEPERVGLLESAGRGTVFLDEIGDLSPGLQTRLAGVLERSEVLRIGEAEPRRIDARIVASTHRDLRAEVRAGRFRADFYFRIAAFPIRVPALRERREDLPTTVRALAAEAQEKIGRDAAGIEAEAVELLATARLPGNFRQLENALVRAAALAPEGSPIGAEHLDPELFAPEPDLATGESSDARRLSPAQGSNGAPPERKPLRSARAEFEASYIAESLAEQRGNVSRTARLLGVSRVALHKKIVAYGLR
ncbi:MAG: sigma 54-interacting transcriptional regulator [Alphaproteobacteria bacterium]